MSSEEGKTSRRERRKRLPWPRPNYWEAMDELFSISQVLADDPSTRHHADASPIDAVAALLAGLLSSGWTRSELVLLMNEAADVAYEEDAEIYDGDCRSEVFDDFLEVLKG